MSQTELSAPENPSRIRSSSLKMSLGVKCVADQLFLEVRHAKEQHGRCERVFIFINLKL